MSNRIYVSALVLCLALAPLACKRKKVRVQQTDEEAPRVSSMVHMADPRAASQLISGFHDVEQNSWRWTSGRFSVILRPPRGAAQKGAVLKMKFTVLDVVMQKLKSQTLSATLEGLALAPETITQPGEYTYTRDIPADKLGGETVRVDFALYKFLPASSQDNRDLGVVASSIALEPK
jgi:hypothetical protein